MAIGWANNIGKGRVLPAGKLIAIHAGCRSRAAGEGLDHTGYRVPCCMLMQLSGVSSAGTFRPDIYGHTAIANEADIISTPLVLSWYGGTGAAGVLPYGSWGFSLQCPNSNIISVTGDDVTPGGRIDVQNTTAMFATLTGPYKKDPDDGNWYASLSVVATVELNGGMLCSGSFGSTSNPFQCSALPPAVAAIFNSETIVADPTDLSSLTFTNQLARSNPDDIIGGIYYGPVAFTGGTATITAVPCKSANSVGDDMQGSAGELVHYLERDQVMNAPVEIDGDSRQHTFLQWGGRQYWTEYLLDINNPYGKTVVLRQGAVSDTMTGPAYWVMEGGGLTVTNSRGYPFTFRALFAKAFSDADPTPAGDGWALAYLVVNNGQQGWGPTTGDTIIPGPPYTGITIPPAAPHTWGIGNLTPGILPVNVTNKCAPFYCVMFIDPSCVTIGVQITRSVQTWAGSSSGYTITLAQLRTDSNHQARWVLTITKGATTWKFFTRLDWHAPTWDVCGHFGSPNNVQGIGCPPYTSTTAASPWFPFAPTTTDGSKPEHIALKSLCPQTTRAIDSVCLCSCAGQVGGSTAQCVSLWVCYSTGIGEDSGTFGIATLISTTNVANPAGMGTYFNTWYIDIDPDDNTRCRARWYNLDGPPAIDGSCSGTPPPVPPVPVGSRCTSGVTTVGTNNPLTCVAMFVAIQINGSWGPPAFYGFQKVDLTVWGALRDVWIIGVASDLAFNYCSAIYYQTCNTVTGNDACVRNPATEPTGLTTGYSCRMLGGIETDCASCCDEYLVTFTGGGGDPWGILQAWPDGLVFSRDTLGDPNRCNYYALGIETFAMGRDENNVWQITIQVNGANCGLAFKANTSTNCPAGPGYFLVTSSADLCAGQEPAGPGSNPADGYTYGCYVTCKTPAGGESLMRSAAAPAARQAKRVQSQPATIVEAPVEVQAERLQACRDCPNWRSHDRDGNAVEACQKLIDRGKLGQLMHPLGIPNANAQCADPDNRRWLPVLQ